MVQSYSEVAPESLQGALDVLSDSFSASDVYYCVLRSSGGRVLGTSRYYFDESKKVAHVGSLYVDVGDVSLGVLMRLFRDIYLPPGVEQHGFTSLLDGDGVRSNITSGAFGLGVDFWGEEPMLHFCYNLQDDLVGEKVVVEDYDLDRFRELFGSNYALVDMGDDGYVFCKRGGATITVLEDTV